MIRHLGLGQAGVGWGGVGIWGAARHRHPIGWRRAAQRCAASRSAYARYRHPLVRPGTEPRGRSGARARGHAVATRSSARGVRPAIEARAARQEGGVRRRLQQRRLHGGRFPAAEGPRRRPTLPARCRLQARPGWAYISRTANQAAAKDGGWQHGGEEAEAGLLEPPLLLVDLRHRCKQGCRPSLAGGGRPRRC